MILKETKRFLYCLENGVKKIKFRGGNMESLKPFRFNGPDYIPEIDDERLTGQILRIFEVMEDSEWRTLDEIESLTDYPQASISAQLRHMRKPRFGSHRVNKRRRGTTGTFEYQLVPNLIRVNPDNQILLNF